jgi:hypothetical protein
MRPAPGKPVLIVLDHAGNTERHGDPAEDDIEWTLDGAVRRPKAAPGEGDPANVGMGQPREIEVVEGELVLREKQAAAMAKWARMGYHQFKSRRRSLEDVTAYSKAKKYKRGWIGHFMIEQNERFPPSERAAA